VSPELVPITSAEQLVRHLLAWDCSADEIDRRLKDAPLWRHATLPDARACGRLLRQRRRYDVALERTFKEGCAPTEEAIAELLKVGVRTVDGWRHGR